MDKKLGIGILSTDRPNFLGRLIVSLKKYTETPCDIIVYDDSSIKKRECRKIAKQLRCSFLDTGKRIGIAKNTNRLLLGLKDYDYKVMFNNDVEILKKGWETAYIDAMNKTNIHCFCFRQLGLWGACKEGEDNKKPDKRFEYNNTELAVIGEYPQGAMLFFDKLTHEKVGYYDAELFKSYGMSHHDWSHRISLSGIQPKGIYDIGNSNEYLKVYPVESITPFNEKNKIYRINQELFRKKKIELDRGLKDIYVEYS